MNKKIIGVTGIAGSGKDTFALAIKELEPNTDIFAFAGPLKEACKILFNFSNDQLYDPVIKEEIDDRWKKSPRQILQWLGTDILRNNIDQNFFITNMKQKIEASKAEYIIITDIRFNNESEFIKSIGGKVIKIERPDAKTTIHSNHITEQGIANDLVDVVISNDSTIEEFRIKANSTVKKLFGDIRDSYIDMPFYFTRKPETDTIRFGKSDELRKKAVETEIAKAKHELELLITHQGGWGGFFHGHKCCGKCSGNLDGKCHNDCKQICGKPQNLDKIDDKKRYIRDLST